MLKKVFNVENLYGEKVTKVCYFNLTKAEILKFTKFEKKFNNLQKRIEDDEEAENSAIEVVDSITEIIKMAYGKPSEDGISFKKSKEEAEDFVNSPMFDALLEELLTGGEKAIADFMVKIVPGNITSEQLLKEMAKAKKAGAIEGDVEDSNS